MDITSYKTIAFNQKSVKKNWILIDAANQPLGRMASKASIILRGKNKPSFTPHIDCGDNVIILNAQNVHLTGDKWAKKKYLSHSGYPGGQKSILAKDLKKKHPTRIIERSIKGMLPKNRLGRKIFNNLYVYPHNKHPHEAQKPQIITIN